RVTEVALDRDRVRPGENVTVTATVTNDADYPGRATVTVSADGEQRAERDIALAGSDRRTVEIPLTFESAGTYRLLVADGQTSSESTVRVVDAESTEGWASGDALANALAVVAAIVLLGGATYVFRRP
ncbi:MAG TPA: CARDB domain-containing protein, partial [Natronoarchaeum rubrum]|nr:CARDB domain-containing protein [Natronoarchaeum rubrum]